MDVTRVNSKAFLHDLHFLPRIFNNLLVVLVLIFPCRFLIAFENVLYFCWSNWLPFTFLDLFGFSLLYHFLCFSHFLFTVSNFPRISCIFDLFFFQLFTAANVVQLGVFSRKIDSWGVGWYTKKSWDRLRMNGKPFCCQKWLICYLKKNYKKSKLSFHFTTCLLL